jgi:hypothetical protein
MHIFLDTEYTDMTPNRQLISLGLCSPNGEEGYWEVPFDRKICSEFVVDNVLPHLGSYANAQCSLKELRANILNWIKIVSDERDLIEICSDSQTDWDLFLKACNYDIPKK